MDITWTDIKAFSSSRNMPLQYVETADKYFIWCFDGPMQVSCQIQKNNGADQTDFEANYKASANKNLWQYDDDGAQIVRVKAAKRGWTYQALGIEFETARLSDTLVCKDSTGENIPGFTYKSYDANGNEVTTAGLLNANYATIVKTVIDFEPPYDYEVIGGNLRTVTDITSNMRLWIVAVPDVPANQGGSKEMAVNINLRYLTPGNVYEVDGRVAKYLAYNATYHTNKLRFILTYPAGTNEQLAITLEYYKA